MSKILREKQAKIQKKQDHENAVKECLVQLTRHVVDLREEVSVIAEYTDDNYRFDVISRRLPDARTALEAYEAKFLELVKLNPGGAIK